MASCDPSRPGTSSASPTAVDSVATSNFEEPVDDAAPRIDYGLTPPGHGANSSVQTSAVYQTLGDSFTAFSPLPVSCRPAFLLYVMVLIK